MKVGDLGDNLHEFSVCFLGEIRKKKFQNVICLDYYAAYEALNTGLSNCRRIFSGAILAAVYNCHTNGWPEKMVDTKL